MVSARRGRVEYLTSALHSELIDVIRGIQAAADERVGHIIVETDDVEVVQAVYSQDFYLSPVALLVEELRGLLQMNFISWRVQQRSRACNRVAHELAILGSKCEPDVDHVVAPIPDFIACFIVDDSARVIEMKVPIKKTNYPN